MDADGGRVAANDQPDHQPDHEPDRPDPRTAGAGHRSRDVPPYVAALASAGAAIVHAAAAGTHAEHTELARLFVTLAIAQAAVGVLGLVSSSAVASRPIVIVNGLALAGWIVTRFVGIDAVPGLEVAEAPGLADGLAAALAAIAVVGALARPVVRWPASRPSALATAAVAVAALTIPALAATTSHQHDHGDDDHAATDDHDHGDDDHSDDDHGDGAADDAAADPDHSDHDHGEDATPAAVGDGAAAVGDDEHDHVDHVDGGDDAAADASHAWPRPWDPTQPIDFSGVDGVTPEQQRRAETLVADALVELPAFADPEAIEALGYHSIGDASTGYEHYINTALIRDDRFLDPSAPESVVFEVDGDDRTLVSAMFIADAMAVDDERLTDFAGPLMQWHVHGDLCWSVGDDGQPRVIGVLGDFGGSCPAGSANAGGENPMVHVWIAPHECGPFAALEGAGAGQAAVGDDDRADLCHHDHDASDGADHESGDHSGHEAADATTPYDPALPIDLGGVDGVTPQQQAFAENLVAATIRDLPQWADLAVVEAAGFHSIGDGISGHEHYINWDWIDDDVWLDPDQPESLVFEVHDDGSKELVSAMFMLPGDTPLDEVPDWGGALMQWHVHGDLCFTDDPVAPRVAGTKPLGSACRAPLVDGTLAPMVHVWITPHPCGPFAALDGVAGGQVPDGEAVLCDHAHGSH